MRTFGLRLTAAIMCLTAIAGLACAATVPMPGSLTVSNSSGRQVQLRWIRVTLSGTEIQYDVYRNDELIATVADGGADPGTGGQIWHANSSYQFFNDNTGWPGQTYDYAVVARTASGESAPAVKSFTVPAPSISNLSASYVNGRKVTLRWSTITGSHFDVYYEIYRDGEKIASFKAGVTGTGEAGDSWEGNTSYQWYYDATAFPGVTHTYRIVAVLFEGCRVDATKELSIPSTDVTNLVTTYKDGRKVELRWWTITGSHFDVRYEIHRDGEKIAEFKAGVTGTGEAGDSWQGNISYQWYYDATAFPGVTHTYKIVAILFEGCRVETTKEVSIPQTGIANLVTTYKDGRKVELRWSPITGSHFDVHYEIHRDDEKIAEFKAGVTGTGDAGDSWQGNISYQYYYDATAFPGATHTYKIVAVLFEGFQIEITRQVSIPQKAITNLYTAYMSGRKVQLRWSPITGSHFDVHYEIHRDGEKIAEFKAGVTGTGETGDSWQGNISYQYYLGIYLANTPTIP